MPLAKVNVPSLVESSMEPYMLHFTFHPDTKNTHSSSEYSWMSATFSYKESIERKVFTLQVIILLQIETFPILCSRIFFDPSVSKSKLTGTYCSWLGNGVLQKSVWMPLLEFECEEKLLLLIDSWIPCCYAALQDMKPALQYLPFKSVTVMWQVRSKSYKNYMVWNVATAYKVRAKQNKHLTHTHTQDLGCLILSIFLLRLWFFQTPPKKVHGTGTGTINRFPNKTVQDAKGVKIIGADQFLPDAVHRPWKESFCWLREYFPTESPKKMTLLFQAKLWTRHFLFQTKIPVVRLLYRTPSLDTNLNPEARWSPSTQRRQMLPAAWWFLLWILYTVTYIYIYYT